MYEKAITVSSYIQSTDTCTNTTTATQLVSGTLVTDATSILDSTYGLTYEIDWYGYMSTGATPGTFRFDVTYASGTAVTLASSQVVSLGYLSFTPPALLSNAYWRFRGHVVFPNTSASGLATVSGDLAIQGDTTPIRGIISTGSGTSGCVSVNTQQSTGSNYYCQGIFPEITWGTASSSNSITLGLGSITKIIT